ncbi:MAG TPA: hypothetical protein PKH33_05390 [bacterium]|nr:hypothetical protein [bacterium]
MFGTNPKSFGKGVWGNNPFQRVFSQSPKAKTFLSRFSLLSSFAVAFARISLFCKNRRFCVERSSAKPARREFFSEGARGNLFFAKKWFPRKFRTNLLSGCLTLNQ